MSDPTVQFPDADGPQRKPVSRLRRAIFTWIVVAACISLSYWLALHGLDTKVADTVASGLLSLGTFLAISYVGASAMDYSLGPFIFGKGTGGYGGGGGYGRYGGSSYGANSYGQNYPGRAPVPIHSTPLTSHPVPPPPPRDDDAKPKMMPADQGDN